MRRKFDCDVVEIKLAMSSDLHRISSTKCCGICSFRGIEKLKVGFTTAWAIRNGFSERKSIALGIPKIKGQQCARYFVDVSG
jgi:alpha-D-ribose 1-methylphosphonate 5-triphosphate synthase subunit PhnI